MGFMQKSKENRIKLVCGRDCEACGACQRGKKEAMLMEAQRIGNALLGKKAPTRSAEIMFLQKN